jgi:probable rRNA maturation factor
MIKINIVSRNKNWLRYINNPQNFFKTKISKFNKKFNKYKKKIVFFTLLLSDDIEIKNLNKKFRKKNKSTDVLSFPFYNKKELVRKLKKDKEIYLGDIIVNLNKIKKKKDKSFFYLEFDRLWVHGLVHLLGYDHKKFKDFNNMIKVEKKFLSYLN